MQVPAWNSDVNKAWPSGTAETVMHLQGENVPLRTSCLCPGIPMLNPHFPSPFTFLSKFVLHILSLLRVKFEFASRTCFRWGFTVLLSRPYLVFVTPCPYIWEDGVWRRRWRQVGSHTQPWWESLGYWEWAKVLDVMTGASAPLYRGPDAQGLAEEGTWQH